MDKGTEVVVSDLVLETDVTAEVDIVEISVPDLTVDRLLLPVMVSSWGIGVELIGIITELDVGNA